MQVLVTHALAVAEQVRVHSSASLAAALVLPLLAPPLRAQVRRGADPVERLERWVREFERARSDPTPQEEAELGMLCADAGLLHAATPERGVEVAEALLSVATARPAPASFSEPGPVVAGSSAARVQAEGRRALARLLAADPAVARWLSSAVLTRSSAPLPRRLAGVQTLEGLYLPPTRLALFACGIEPEPSLRAASVDALCGWADEGVHRFLVAQLRRNEAEPGWVAPSKIRRHFARMQLAPDGAAARELRAHVADALRSADWRRAYRGLQLAPGLTDEMVVPELIEALRTWIERRAAGTGRLRIEADITRELRRRSGRNIGPFPQRWDTWWRARQATGGSAPAEAEAEQLTAAGFFGLRPMTDRVVFVLDRSGSMQNAFQGGERTRYEEAIEQLMKLLESLGPQTHFRVILFSGELRIWSDDLRPATSSNLGLVRSWMEHNAPDGATHLQPAVAQAMRLDGRGQLDLAELEADTVIVLCDGATAEGPGWVVPLMQGPNEAACLVFHSVQIGQGGDGTLEALASESGGDFVRVRG